MAIMGIAAARGARELRARISQDPDPPLLGQHLAHRLVHRHGALGAAPQAEGARPRRQARRTRNRRMADKSPVLAGHVPQQRAPRQDPGDDVPGQGRQAPGRRSPGSTLSRCCCAATACRSSSTSMRSRRSCRRRCRRSTPPDGRGRAAPSARRSRTCSSRRRARRGADDDVPGQRRDAPGRGRGVRPVLLLLERDGQSSWSTSTRSRRCSRRRRSTSAAPKATSG